MSFFLSDFLLIDRENRFFVIKAPNMQAALTIAASQGLIEENEKVKDITHEKSPKIAKITMPSSLPLKKIS